MTSGELAIHFAAMSGWSSPSFAGRSKYGGVVVFGALFAAGWFVMYLWLFLSRGATH